MNPADAILASFLILVAGLDVVASYCLYGEESLGRGQKIAQGALVWVIPVLGAWLVLAILRTSRRESMPERLRSQIDGDGFEGAGPDPGHSGHHVGGHDGGAGDGH